ncbi:MAG: glucokinase [Betaproteobacteria bacterium]|jgi:glucokinase|nr:glucokinase [Betaproteobacteria bacterium]
MNIAGDIGGTKTLLALFEPRARTPQFERRYDSHGQPDFPSLLGQFLDEARGAMGARPQVERACFGIAGPVLDDHVKVTNLPWEMDARALERVFNISRVRLLNDFAAAAHGIEALGDDDVVTLQTGEPVADAPRVVIGAGTGLGVAYMVADGDRYRVIAGEGGHAAFAPADEEQVALWRHVHAGSNRVVLEHVLSGSGLARIYEFLRSQRRHPESPIVAREMAEGDSAAAIARNALGRDDPLANAALDLFVAIYGSAAGDHALNVVARGGVFIAGGIAPKILPRIAAGGFQAAFNAKADFAAIARQMPVHVVTNEKLGLIGAAQCAARL